MTATAKPVEIIRETLNSDAMVAQLKSALPPQITVERFNRVAMTLISTTPALLEADRQSLFSSIMSCAQLGLVPDAQIGEAYFTAFKNQVTLIIGYRGLLKLARQSGELKTIYAELIHANDDFKLVQGTDRTIHHEPMWGSDPGDIVGAYAVAHFKDGGYQFEVMSIRDIEAIRNNSFSKNSPAWKGIGYGEMCKKTCLRRLLKYLPLSTDPMGAMGAEDKLESTNIVALAAPEAKPSRLEQFATDDGQTLNVDKETGEVL